VQRGLHLKLFLYEGFWKSAMYKSTDDLYGLIWRLLQQNKTIAQFFEEICVVLRRGAAWFAFENIFVWWFVEIFYVQEYWQFLWTHSMFVAIIKLIALVNLIKLKENHVLRQGAAWFAFSVCRVIQGNLFCTGD
jgi:hypothetical protein